MSGHQDFPASPMGIDRRRFLTLLSLLGAGGIMGAPVVGCREAERRRPPRLVLLYSSCTVNKGFLAPYDPSVASTPNLRRFAVQSRTFERHMTEAPMSGVGFASIFTGRQADQHGVCAHPRKLDPGLHQVSRAFGNAGYECWYWNRHPMASHDLNYCGDVPAERALKRLLRSRNDEFRAILERLASDPSYRVFIATAFTETHFPYRPAGHQRLPAEFERLGMSPEELSELRHRWEDLLGSERFSYFDLSVEIERTLRAEGISARDVKRLAAMLTYFYQTTIHRLDRLFGEVVDAIDEVLPIDESLVTFTADHGEVLFRDSTFFKFCHSFELAPEAVGVPWIVRAPGIRPGRYPDVTRSIDVYPTLCGLAGVDVPQEWGITGVDLSPSLRGESSPPKLTSFSHGQFQRFESPETFFGRFYPARDPELMWASMRMGDQYFKIAKLDAQNPTFEPALFDLARDPEERINLFDDDAIDHRRAMVALQEYRRRLVGACQAWERTDSGLAPEDSRRRLEALGYL